jgi:predicted enzyme related to lactoylglutathione lyase
MAHQIQTIIYPVHDLASARALYSALLGVAPTVDTPYYVGFRVGDQDIGLDPGGHQKGMTGPVCYCHVEDLAASVRLLLDAGAALIQDARDVGGGKQIATMRDADGNTIGLLQLP